MAQMELYVKKLEVLHIVIKFTQLKGSDPFNPLSETLNFATEVAEGTCTDIYMPKKK